MDRRSQSHRYSCQGCGSQGDSPLLGGEEGVLQGEAEAHPGAALEGEDAGLRVLGGGLHPGEGALPGGPGLVAGVAPEGGVQEGAPLEGARREEDQGAGAIPDRGSADTAPALAQTPPDRFVQLLQHIFSTTVWKHCMNHLINSFNLVIFSDCVK